MLPDGELISADGRAGIDASLVARLIASQFPQWADLPVHPVEVDGWDNRTYRLGETMTVRLPTATWYEPAITKEHRWLPVLAPWLPVPIPTPIALGSADGEYLHRWAVRDWLDGEMARADRVDDMEAFAVAVAEFILALQGIDASGGPVAGAHSFYRGASLTHYDDETWRALHALDGYVDTDTAADVWRTGLDAEWAGTPVWFHGDIARGNLLVRGGKLCAVIDFGTSGVGDPACDLVIAWTMFRDRSRGAFRAAVGQDAGTWARARGWALWKAAICLAEEIDTDPRRAAVDRRVIAEVLDDHRASRR